MKFEFVEMLLADLHVRFPEINEGVARQIIYNHVKNYDITEREFTELVLPEFTTEALLRAFRIYKSSQNLSQGSIEQYELTARQLCDYIGKPLQLITTDDIIYFLTNYKLENDISNRTMENKRTNLNSVFTTLYKYKKLDCNPMDLVEHVKYEDTVQLPLFDEELERIFIACENNKRDYALIRLALDTGCRAKEIINIRMKDIDMIRRRIKVLGKGNKERIVIFSGATITRLNDYLNERLIKENKKEFSPNDFLFANYNSPYGGMSKSSLRTAIKRIGDEANVPRLHPHLLRHTTATNLSHAGVPIDKISRYLGHANINTTMIYIKKDNDSTLLDISRVIA